MLVCRDEAGFYIGSAINIDQNKNNIGDNGAFFSALSYPIAFSRVSKETLDLFLANTICLRTACTKDAQDQVVIADLKDSRSVRIAQNDHANSPIWICVGRECPLHDWMLADEGLMFSDIQDFDGLPEPNIRKALSIGLEPVA